MPVIKRARKEPGINFTDLEAARQLLQTGLGMDGRVRPERVIRTVADPGDWESAVVKAFDASADALGAAKDKARRAVAKIKKDGDLVGGK